MSATRSTVAARLYTIGHSNRSSEALLAMLRAYEIGLLVDIRAFPRSRRFPHFDRATFQAMLTTNNIGYEWRGDVLGGYRKPRADSRHTALTDAAFRGFADYMESPRFVDAVTRLLDLAIGTQTAVMCAEADYHHCHRQLIADHLLGRDVEVIHIASTRECARHLPNPCLDTDSQPCVYNRHEQGDLFASL